MVSTIYQLIEFMEKSYSDRIAFQYYDNKEIYQITYREYIKDIKQFASYLKREMPDIEKRHIGILAKNSYEYAVCLYGIILAGAVAVPLNMEENLAVISYEIKYADVSYVFTDGVYQKRELGYKDKFFDITRNINEYRNCKRIYKLEDTCDIETLALLLFTSGTTGKSKAVMLSQKNIFTPIKNFVNQSKIGITTRQRMLVMVPLYHVSGIAALLTTNAAGNLVNLCTSMKHLYRDIQVLESDYTLVVPVVLKSFYKDIKKGKIYRLGKIKVIFCGGATVDSEMFLEFQNHGIKIIQAYGLTEIFGNGTINNTTTFEKANSIGIPSSECKVKIENNEILLRSEAVMQGYYKNPEETRKAIHNGWLHTGDLGYLDQDGYLYLSGRKKNLIILESGENVSPEELECLLRKNPIIQEVVVRESNNKICAEIYCQKDQYKLVDEYIQKVNRSLAYYKRIVSIKFRNEPFKRNASGKIMRREIKD